MLYSIKVITRDFESWNIGSIPIGASSSLFGVKDAQGSSKALVRVQILVGEELMERPVETCCGSDLMSDVLAFTKCNTLLCTGLTNMQVIRTAGITDLCGIIIVRGKLPGPDFLDFARESQMPVLSTNCTLFEACGLLYVAGLRGCSQEKGGCGL